MPYSLAVINFAVQFLIFIVFFVVDLTINGVDARLNPLYFLISVIVVHSIIAIFSKSEPQLGQIITAKLRLYRSRIPNEITV